MSRSDIELKLKLDLDPEYFEYGQKNCYNFFIYQGK